ncbi:dipeptide ABC transporter ATP-binding protein [Nocardiopsis ganjiahuensis]|uniref:dipeptide ABC transporter ATP-binding protein n=1 Tax=Nocardiopsis ganjiahuensis TaxID=239984 RepID=UPI00034C9742|nr:ABC transporter ATP-binding protein [Nocardiopsis ganjiahuensis]
MTATQARSAGASRDDALVTVTGLRVDAGPDRLVHPLDLTIRAGERVGLIGESGSGKTLTALSLIGLLPDELRHGGTVALRDSSDDLLNAPERELCGLRGRRISMVFQEPMTALNPLMQVGKQVSEVLTQHRTLPNRREVRERVLGLLESVRLPDPERLLRAYPHQLSGGQRQRIMLAMAFANDPDLLICDEPTTALDVTVQRQVLDLLDEAVRSRGTSLLFVSHDLAVVARTCDRVLVMQHGRVVESGSVTDVLTAPRHDYTKQLLAASRLEPTAGGARRGAGSPPETGSGAGAGAPTGSEGPAGTERPAGAAELSEAAEPLIRVSGLHRTHRSRRRTVHALKNVDLQVRAGDRIGIVGESGSGKTTLLKILAGLDRPTSGSVSVCGVDVARASKRSMRRLREQLQTVFQDPMGSLDPRMTVREIVEEPLIGHSGARSGRERRELTARSLESVGIPASAAERYPHQFSGGQRQRISIARALVTDPDVLVADEPVSALDVSVQAQVLALLNRLVDERGLTLLMVSHDLAVVRHLCDRIVVMRHGEVVEAGPAERVYGAPEDDYTRALLEATPSLDRVLAEKPSRGGTGDRPPQP